MALSDVTVTFNLTQLLGEAFDARRTRAYVKTNVANGTLMDTSTGEIRLGDQKVTVGDDGTGSFTTWAPGVDGNPTSWQTSLVVEYPRTGQRDRQVRTFGPYTITASADLADLEEEQAVPAEYLTQVTEELQTYSDAAEVSATSAAASATSAAASATTAVNAKNQASEIALGDADATLAAAIENPASDTYSALSASFGFWRNVKAFGAVGDGIADDTAAVLAAVSEGAGVFFPSGTYRITSPIAFTNVNRFQGEGPLSTIIRYRGPADTFAFSHTFTGDGSDEWPGRVSFADLTIEGDATAPFVSGNAATVSGISCSDNTGTLVNIPYYNLSRVRFLRLATGVQLEGYSHTLTDCEAYECGIGFDLTHPEQGILTNCWTNYCDVGLSVNVRKPGHYGHLMHVIGGAYQRCRIGIEIHNFLEPVIETYYELNEEADLVLGDPADTTYTSSVKNARILGAFHSSPSVANVALYGTVGAEIDFSRIWPDAVTVPQVLANGYSKFIEVTYHPEGTHSASTPWDFVGTSADTSTARALGSPSGREFASLATDVNGSTATTPTDMLSVTFTPSGPTAVVRAAGIVTQSNASEFTYFQIVGNSQTRPLGRIAGFTGSPPQTLAGAAMFSDLTPGTAYTFTLRFYSSGGSLLCRPVTQGALEQMTLEAADL